MLAGFYWLLDTLMFLPPFEIGRYQWDARCIRYQTETLAFSHSGGKKDIGESKTLLLRDSVFIQGLSLYHLKIVQVLLAITTGEHPERKEEKGRYSEWANDLSEETHIVPGVFGVSVPLGVQRPKRGSAMLPSFTWADPRWLSIMCHQEVRKVSLIPHAN